MLIRLPPRYIFEYLADGRTPIRALTDIAVARLSHYFDGEDDIIELGASSDYYAKYFGCKERYLISNISGDGLAIDMTRMALRDESVRYFTSFFVLEHVRDFESFISEAYRVMKTNGRMMIAVPFIYVYHAAPDDYFRFTESSLRHLFEKFNILEIIPLGNRGINIAEFLIEKSWHTPPKTWLNKLWLRLIGAFFLFFGMHKESDPVFAGAFICVVEK